MSAEKQQKIGDGVQHRKSQLKAIKKQRQQQQHLAEQKTKYNTKWPKKGEVHVRLSLGLNIHTFKGLMTFQHTMGRLTVTGVEPIVTCDN